MGAGRYYGVARGGDEVERAFELRREVFCAEQGVDERAEFDSHDATATHIVGVDDDQLIATCRLIFEGPVCRLGRMAVVDHRRGTGVGRRLLAAAEREARAAGAREIVVHAQRQAEGFYRRCWFVAEGETFVEEGIDHVRMRKTIFRD